MDKPAKDDLILCRYMGNSKQDDTDWVVDIGFFITVVSGYRDLLWIQKPWFEGGTFFYVRLASVFSVKITSFSELFSMNTGGIPYLERKISIIKTWLQNQNIYTLLTSEIQSLRNYAKKQLTLG